MGLHNFKNCPVLIDIKFLIIHQRQRDNQRLFFFFCIVALYLFPTSWLGKVLQCLFQTDFLFIWKAERVVSGHVRQVVVLYCNNCMGICLGRLSIGRLRQVFVLQKCCLNRFDCTSEKHFIILEACVCYFLSIFIFSSNYRPSKTIKNVFYFIEKALSVLEIFKFLFFSLLFHTFQIQKGK